MPSYSHLATDKLDNSNIGAKINVMKTLGVPYPTGFAAEAKQYAEAEAELISKELDGAGISCPPDKKIIAVISYIKKLGKDLGSTGTAK